VKKGSISLLVTEAQTQQRAQLRPGMLSDIDN
jgi:hypothetical protein